MPWCPKCQSEYREGFTHCKECDVELTTEKPDPKNHEAGEKSWADEYNWALLANVQDDHEADILESLLAEGGIPLYRKSSAGQQAMEMITGNVVGLDLYVPLPMRAEAMNLLKDQVQGEIDEEALEAEAASTLGEEEEGDSRGGLYVVGFLILFVLVIWWISR